MKKQLLLPALLVLVLISAFTTQFDFTDLKVTVRNELGNVESGAKVSLYKTKDDYEKSANAVATETTDEKGNASFKKLAPTSYYLGAEKGDRNNFGAGEKTDTLRHNRINKITVIISE